MVLLLINHLINLPVVNFVIEIIMEAEVNGVELYQVNVYLLTLWVEIYDAELIADIDVVDVEEDQGNYAREDSIL